MRKKIAEKKAGKIEKEKNREKRLGKLRKKKAEKKALKIEKEKTGKIEKENCRVGRVLRYDCDMSPPHPTKPRPRLFRSLDNKPRNPCRWR